MNSNKVIFLAAAGLAGYYVYTLKTPSTRSNTPGSVATLPQPKAPSAPFPTRLDQQPPVDTRTTRVTQPIDPSRNYVKSGIADLPSVKVRGGFSAFPDGVIPFFEFNTINV